MKSVCWLAKIATWMEMNPLVHGTKIALYYSSGVWKTELYGHVLSSFSFSLHAMAVTLSPETRNCTSIR